MEVGSDFTVIRGANWYFKRMVVVSWMDIIIILIERKKERTKERKKQGADIKRHERCAFYRYLQNKVVVSHGRVEREREREREEREKRNACVRVCGVPLTARTALRKRKTIASHDTETILPYCTPCMRARFHQAKTRTSDFRDKRREKKKIAKMQGVQAAATEKKKKKKKIIKKKKKESVS